MPHSRTSPLSDSRRWKNAGRRLSAWFGMPTVMLPAFMPTTSAPGSISATIDSSRGTMSGCDRRLTWYPEPNWFLRNSGVPNARMRPAAMMAMRSPSASASSCSSAAARVRSGNGPDRAARKATEAPCARCGLPPTAPTVWWTGPAAGGATHHAVRREHAHAVLLDLGNHVPNAAPAQRVQPGGRLVCGPRRGVRAQRARVAVAVAAAHKPAPSSTICGSPTSDTATLSRRCIPPERVFARAAAEASSCTSSSCFSTCARISSSGMHLRAASRSPRAGADQVRAATHLKREYRWRCSSQVR